MGLTGVSSDSWWKNILEGISAPNTANNRSNLNAWTACEGGTATFNPFNTTLPWPRSTCYNSVCVRNYANFQDGVSATIATIEQGNMSDIRHALQNNLNRDGFANAIGADPWGTSAACVRTASGGGTGGVPGPPGPIGGTSTPAPPAETARSDWSGHVRRSAAQFDNATRTLHARAVLIQRIRLR